MNYKVLNRETISSIAASVGFTATYIPPTDVECEYAVVQVVDSDMRICIDGTTPTATKGLKINEDTIFEVWGGQSLTNFRCIDDSGTAKVEVIYMGRGG